MDQRYLSGRHPRPPAERRTQARLRVHLPAHDPEGHSFRVHDISRTGLSLVTEELLPVGASLDLDLLDTASGQRCAFRGLVVWSSPARAGLRFIELSPEQERWLTRRFMEWTSAGHQAEG